MAEHPYALPRTLPPDLDRVQAYWRGLLRGSAEMPFWDDVNLSFLPDLAPRLFMIDVFEGPERFRFAIVGQGLTDGGGRAEPGGFVDEASLDPPLDFLGSQCSATVESMAPTFHRTGKAGDGAYSRLLLPLWGEGQVRMILGVVAEG
jgi:hypothetical protein